MSSPTSSPTSSRPLGSSYTVAVLLALLALSPFIILTSASQLWETHLSQDLATSHFGLTLAEALASAAYAFGAVLAADLIQRFSARSIYLGCEALFLGGSLLSALAGSEDPFLAGRVLQGLATGMLLVAALPPLVTRFGVKRLPLTAAVVNLGLFGMVTLGPLLGGATGSHWRGAFWVAALLALLAAGLALLGFEGGEGGDPRTSFDASGAPLALLATLLPFLGVSLGSLFGLSSFQALIPLVLGLLALLFLLERQYRKSHPLMPLKLIVHTLPVTGISTAMVTGAGVTAMTDLLVVYLLALHHTPLFVGTLLLTQVLGVALAALLFSRMLRTRWLPVLALGGLLVTCLAGLLLLSSSSLPAEAFAGLFLGFGAGAGVTPALFLAGLSSPSSRLGPTFALVELLRSEAAFIVAPVLLQLASRVKTPLAALHAGVLALLLLLVVVGGVALGILLLGGARPHAPNLERWLEGEEPAYDSPPLAATVRS